MQFVYNIRTTWSRFRFPQTAFTWITNLHMDTLCQPVFCDIHSLPYPFSTSNFPPLKPIHTTKTESTNLLLLCLTNDRLDLLRVHPTGWRIAIILATRLSSTYKLWELLHIPNIIIHRNILFQTYFQPNQTYFHSSVSHSMDDHQVIPVIRHIAVSWTIPGRSIQRYRINSASRYRTMLDSSG